MPYKSSFSLISFLTASSMFLPMIGLVSSPAVQAQVSKITTEFACVPNGTHYATIARRGDRKTPPIVIWTKSQGELTPQERCKIVSGNLNRAIKESGVRRLSAISLSHGVVNNNQVICFVTPRDKVKVCSSTNIIMTLRPDDNPKEVLQQIRDFSKNATGNPVIRGKQDNEIYDLGLGIERVLTQAENVVAPFSSNASNP